MTAFVKLRFGTRTIGRFSGDKIPLIKSLTMQIRLERKMPKKIEPAGKQRLGKVFSQLQPQSTQNTEELCGPRAPDYSQHRNLAVI